MIKPKRNSCEEHRVAISCADDANFWTSSTECELKMQEIVDLCIQIHEAPRIKVQKRESYVV